MKDLYLIKFHKIDFVNGIDASVLTALSQAVQAGKLPKLAHLSFEDCRRGFHSKYSVESPYRWPLGRSHFELLLSSPWPTLSCLDLCECHLKLKDFQDLSEANGKGFFPNLRSLLVCDLYRENSSAIVPLFSHSWPKITKLVLDNLATSSGKEVNRIWEKIPMLLDLAISLGPKQMPTGFNLPPEAVPGLEVLKFSHFRIPLENLLINIRGLGLTKLDINNCEGITGMISGLKHQTFSSLNTLLLSNCKLHSQDLNVLAQASVGDRLPQLKHLDISKNQRCAGHLDCLFDEGCRWDSLLVLDIRQTAIKKLSQN